MSNIHKIAQEDVDMLMKEGIHQDIIDRIKSWQLFIEEIRQGYEYSIYEYIHDLAKREAIDILLSKHNVSPASVRMCVTQLDNAFFDLTRSINKPITENNTHIIWMRIPRKLSESFKEDLKIYGIDPNEG
jgi:hypothetical protein